MFETIKRLALGLTLIALAAAVLLYTDTGSRQRARQTAAAANRAGKVFRVALVQHSSLPVLEDGIQGVVAELAARGYTEGGRIQFQRYNAEGDIGTANTIAREVTSGTRIILTMAP